eukprot:3308538-Alexandrium_andersonii.AAC.1
MATSCRAGEVFSRADSLRHLLQGARAGRARRPLEQDSSDSDEELGPEQDAERALLRTSWTTTP